MKVSLWLASATVAIAALGCKPTAPQTASYVKDAPAAAADSCNLSAMDEASKTAAKANFNCAYNALKTAGKLATGTVAADAVKVLDGAIEIYEGLEAAQGLYEEIDDFIKNNGQEPGANLALDDAPPTDAPTDAPTGGSQTDKVIDGVDQATGVLDKAKEKVDGTKTGRTAMFQCLGGMYEEAKAAFEIFKLARSLKDMDRLSSEQIKTLITIGFDSVTKVILKMAETTGRCGEWAQGKRIKEFNKLLKGVEKVSSAIDTFKVVATCGVDITKGAVVLVKNTGCLIEDLEKLRESRAAVQRALAFVGSRMFNHAKYTGCNECVKSGTFTRASTDYNNCRTCCENTSGNHVFDNEPKKKSSWTITCQLTCAVAKTDGILWDGTDTGSCDAMKQVFHVSRTYRKIFIADEGKSGADRRASAEQQRGNVREALAAIEANWNFFSPDDDRMSLDDVKAVINNAQAPEAARNAARVFGEQYVDNGVPYFYGLLDSAGDNGNKDGVATRAEVGYLSDEIREYRDETEME